MQSIFGIVGGSHQVEKFSNVIILENRHFACASHVYPLPTVTELAPNEYLWSWSVQDIGGNMQIK